VINYVLHDICSKAKDTDAGYMDPLFYIAVNSQGRTLRWNVPSSRLLLVPIIHDRHWTLLVVNHYQKKFKYYDSLQHYTVENLPDFLKNVISFFHDNISYTRSYGMEVVELWKQNNGNDCGIYVMYIAKALVEREWILINKYAPGPETIQNHRYSLHNELSLLLV
jgi:Ulp1 family protease